MYSLSRGTYLFHASPLTHIHLPILHFIYPCSPPKLTCSCIPANPHLTILAYFANHFSDPQIFFDITNGEYALTKRDYPSPY